jgi:dihydroorotase
MTYDILIKAGKVVDPAQKIDGKFDIGIRDGKIAAIESDIAANEAKRLINAGGKLVTPGLIDIHAHVAEGIIDIGLNPDEAGVKQGVTTVCDGGSLGCKNFLKDRRFTDPRCETDTFWFINVSNEGLLVMPEIRNRHDIDVEATLRVIEEHRDIIKGVKFRAIGTAAQALGVEAASMAKRIANEAGLPLMVHIGRCFSEADAPHTAESAEAYTREVLPLLERGDIISHIYTPNPGGVIKANGNLIPEFEDAIKRGVIMDVAHGLTGLSFTIAKKGIEKGVLPDTISTDLSTLSINGPVFNLAAVMTKFIALDLSLNQVVKMVTINPARVLGEEQQRGSLKIGMPAYVSIMEMKEKDVVFTDGKAGNTLTGKFLLVPHLTLKSVGDEVKTIPSTSTQKQSDEMA